MINLFLENLCTLLSDIIFIVLTGSKTPDLVQGLGIALLTILIPLFIAVFPNTLSITKTKFKTLDFYVLFEEFFNYKKFIFYTFIIFFSLLFWAETPKEHFIYFNFFLFLASITGIAYLTQIIIKIFRWLKDENWAL